MSSKGTGASGCLSSPTFKCTRLGIDRIEMDFYPGGVAGSPPRVGTLVVRSTRGTRMNFQVFMGCKRSSSLWHTFTGWMAGGYRHDFPKPTEEVGCDDSIVVGVDIFSSSRNGRNWVV
eukprot:GHVR01059754.1.p1 GENE.GHVR01059754.1~~GHVR01059754.1.p1  ORF type:complete len:118 (-),score=30.48 GHVR01059754.1:83-436(-)